MDCQLLHEESGYDIQPSAATEGCRSQGAQTIERGFYVQVRYPHAQRWETVAVSATRGVAAKLAGDMYRDLRNDAGQSPVQVRIASDELLRREGGDQAIRDSAAQLWQRAQAVSRAAVDPYRTGSV
jgi:hypothetical protein